MTFNGKKAIYLQIADYISDKVLLDIYKEDERVPSVRETASDVEVNSNTVMRAYDWLQGQQIIYTKRGLGYFVCPKAKKQIMQQKRQEFIEDTVPELAQQMKLLGITTEELTQLINR